MVTRALGVEELRRVPSTVRAGWITLDLDKPLDGLKVPPGAIQDFTLAGVTYQPLSGLLPLVLANPVLRQAVRIGVRRSRIWTLDVFFGANELTCTAVEVAGEHQCHYHVDSLALPGATWRIHWETSQQSPPMPNL